MTGFPSVPNYLQPSWWDTLRFWWAWWRIRRVRDTGVRLRLSDNLWNAWVGRFRTAPPSRQLQALHETRSQRFGL
jgi:hypothetical protein